MCEPKGEEDAIRDFGWIFMMWLKHISYKDGHSPDLEDVKMSLKQRGGVSSIRFLNLSLDH